MVQPCASDGLVCRRFASAVTFASISSRLRPPGAELIAGFVAAANALGGVKSLVEAYKIVSPWFRTTECKGQPVTELRRRIWENINAGGESYTGARWRAQDLLVCVGEDWDALNALGAVEYYTGNFGLAEQFFRRAVKADPEQRGLKLNLADTLVELQRFDAALTEYRILDDGTPSLTYRIGRTMLLASRFAEARRILSSIASDFGEEAKPGKARILEAAALVGLSRGDAASREQHLSLARHAFMEGFNLDRAWWTSVLETRRYNRYEPFAKVIAILDNQHKAWMTQ